MNTIQFQSNVIISENLEKELLEIVNQYPEDKVFLVTEENTHKLCLPVLGQNEVLKAIPEVTIPAGEENKKLGSVEKIWLFLSQNGADRRSLVINLGGGMLTDLGSFAASTYKRGTDFINIPTTLLSQVDASVGGKTGFNFNGYKNEIGVINQPKMVIIDTAFLRTIDKLNFLSGYAEMIKHGLIHSRPHWDELQNFDLDNIDYDSLKYVIGRSVAVKDYFVTEDPNERGIRKALNLGHTFGHAFESLAMKQERPILHGFAVAYGIIPELYLSAKKCGFPESQMESISKWLIGLYGKFEVEEKDTDAIYELITHDKKNVGKRINFTLIPEIGKVMIDQHCGKEEIKEALDYFRKLNR